MKALGKSLCAVVLSCAFAGSAVAATATTTTTPPSGSTSDAAPSSSMQPIHIRQKLRDDLAKAGFTDITVMPTSYMVRAKDSEGNPVMMVVNPDSVTEVTEEKEPPVSGAIKGPINGSSSNGATKPASPANKP